MKSFTVILFLSLFVIFSALLPVQSVAQDTIEVSNFAFTPDDITVPIGTDVTFKWISGSHTTTSDATSGPDFWNAPMDNGNQFYTETIDQGGAHRYYCIPHGGPGGAGMSGIVRGFVCEPDTTIIDAGLSPPDSLTPCIERNAFYQHIVQFKNFDSVDAHQIDTNLTGFAIIDSINIIDISSIPSGLSYYCNKPDCGYLNSEVGCILISGTTLAPAGDYTLGFTVWVKMTFGGFPLSLTMDSAMLAGVGLTYTLKVIEPGEYCSNTGTGGNPAVNANFNSGLIHCDGVPVTFTDVSAGSVVSWAWDFGSGASPPTASTEGPHAVTYASTGSDTVTLTVTDSLGLTDDTSMIVTINANPTITTSGDVTICSGESTNLTSMPNPAGGSFFWTGGGISNPTQQNVSVNPTSTTAYTVTYTDGNLCSASASLSVTVLPSPVINGLSDVTICQLWGSALLDASGTTGASTYSWSPSTGLDNPNIAAPTASPSATTTYTLTATGTNSCATTEDVVVTVDPCTGVAPSIQSAEIIIQPNPTKGLIELRIANANFKDYNIEVFDLTGQTVLVENNIVEFNHLVDLSDLPAGVYHLKVSSSKGELSQRIVVE